MPRDLYEVLGVPRTASEAEIRHAFWELAKRYHPDVNPGSSDAARRFVEVGNAAETLLDTRLRARYDETHAPAATARPSAAAPKPPPRPPPPSTARAAAPPPPTARKPAEKRAGGGRWSSLRALTVIAFVGVLAWWMGTHTGQSQNNKSYGQPVNGSVVWKAADFSVADGWGINLAGNGRLIQIVPGTSTDIEFTGGSLESAGQLAQLPPGETATFQHCISAVEQASSQSDPVSQITPTTGSSLCASGSGGDLASILIIGADGSGLTIDITVWENV